PYIPLNNEGYALFKYKKIRLHPLAETDIGWGHDTASQGRTSYDVNIALGVEYAIAWHLHAVDISCTPALLGNMGTNSYFFLSQAAPYISHSKGFIKYLKNPHYAGTKAANAIRHIGNNNFIADTSSTKTTSSGLNRMEFNNIAAGAELSLSWLSWTLRGDLQAFLPVGAATDHTLSWYGSLTCEYDF
ncbi:MAG: hypothetical protein IRZ29_01805, partial [Thermoflavifilum sp.]|nr:hypothetical protein [Thermoflavifilum sp.]